MISTFHGHARQRHDLIVGCCDKNINSQLLHLEYNDVNVRVNMKDMNIPFFGICI